MPYQWWECERCIDPATNLNARKWSISIRKPSCSLCGRKGGQSLMNPQPPPPDGWLKDKEEITESLSKLDRLKSGRWWKDYRKS